MACGMAPVRIWLSGSRRITSRRQCSRFSISQWPCQSASRALGPACWGSRLVTAQATSRLRLPFASRMRSTRQTWAAPGQPRWAAHSRLMLMVRVSMRSCPFSTVPAQARSGGGCPMWADRARAGVAAPPSALTSSGGKGVAKGNGEIGH